MYLSISDRIPPYPAISRHIPPYPAVSCPPHAEQPGLSPRSGRRARRIPGPCSSGNFLYIVNHGNRQALDKRPSKRECVRFAVSRLTDVVVNTSWGLRISSYPRVSPGIPPYPAISRHIPPYPAADTAKEIGQPRHAAAIAEALRGNGVLTGLFLNSNRIGDEGQGAGLRSSHQ